MLSKIQTSDDVKVGSVEYLTEFIGDAPVSVYIIHGRDGEMLVDTGFSTTCRHIQNWISRKGYNITDIFLTHAHPDHDWNAAKLKEKYGARIWMAEKDVSLIRNFSSQKQYPTSKKYRFRTKWISFWTKTPFFRSDFYTPDVILKEEGSSIPEKYGYDFSVVFLPGHTLGSSGIKTEDVLYCGDAYAVLNGEPVLPPHAASVELMNSSFNKILKIAPEYLACGHGVPFLFSEKFADEKKKCEEK